MPEVNGGNLRLIVWLGGWISIGACIGEIRFTADLQSPGRSPPSEAAVTMHSPLCPAGKIRNMQAILNILPNARTCYHASTHV